MSTEIDYYSLLECERTADDAVLKSAYRKLAMKYHPDKNGGCKEHEEKFKAISEAYEVLKDPRKRALYDQMGHAAFRNGGGGGGGGFGGAGEFTGFNDIFENIFNEFMGGGRGGGRQARRGADLRYDLEITLTDAFNGVTKEIALDTAVACETCHGSGAAPGASAKTCAHCHGQGQVRVRNGFFVVEQSCPVCHGAGRIIADPCSDCRGKGRVAKSRTLSVAVPPGVDQGTRIRLSGEGEAGPQGTPAGDLYIFLHVKQHPLYARDGVTLFARAPISFTTAALGGEIEIPDPSGEVHRIRVAPGTQSGHEARQRGAGMPVLQGRGRGDMIVRIEVETPTRLSARQRELLEEFRTIETGEESPEASGFFAKVKRALG